MANEQLKDFVVTGPDGAEYTVTASPDATDDELINYVQANLPSAPAAQPQVTSAEPQSQGELPGVMAPQTKTPTAWDAQNSQDIIEVDTLAKRNRDDISSYAQTLWTMGERDPDRFNQAMAAKFPNYWADVMAGRSDTGPITAGHIKSLDERDRWYAERGLPNPGNFLFSEMTGEEDPEAPTGFLDTAGTSARRGLANMSNSVTGLGALGAEMVGADEMSDELLADYVENQRKIELNYQRPEGAGSLGEIDSLRDAGLYVTDTLGELAPNITSGATAGIAGREIAKRAVGQAASRYGAIAGAGVHSVSQETGSTFGQTYIATGEKAPVTSLIAGVASGTLESILPIRASMRIGMPQEVVKRTLVDRMAREAGKDFFIEGATEAAQTFIQKLPESYITGESPLTAEMMDEMIESFVRGGIGGGTVGAASSITQRKRPTPTAEISVPSNKKGSKQYKEQIEQTTNEIIDYVNELAADWKSKPNIQVAASARELPKGVNPNAVGVYTGEGAIVLNAENVVKEANRMGVSPDAVVRAVTFHESLGHFALDRQYGEKLNDLLWDIYDNADSQLKGKVDNWIARRGEIYKGRDNIEILALEEVLAEMAEKQGQLPSSVMDKMKNLIKDMARAMGMDWKISDREVRTILATAQRSMVTGGRARGVASSAEPKYMYVGSGYDGMGDAHKARLVQAKIAASRGTDVGPNSDIRRNTGWFRGHDGEWRFEIDDNTAGGIYQRDEEILHQVAEQYDKPTSDIYYKTDGRSSLNILADPIDEPDYHGINVLPLTEVIDHQQLFWGYPELAEVAVTRSWDIYEDTKKEGLNYYGYYDPEQNLIYLNPTISERQAMSTLLHEVQHVVQKLEGFETGGNSSSVMSRIPLKTLMKGVDQYEKYLKADLARKKAKVATYEGIWNHPDVQAIRTSYDDIDYLNNEIEETGPEHADLLKYLEDQLEKAYEDQAKAYDRLKKFANVEDWDAATQQERDEFYEMYELFLKDTVTDQDIADTLLAPKLDVDIARERLKRLRYLKATGDKDGLRSFISEDPYATHEAYEHIGGEVEARDVQHRWEQGVNRQEVAPYSLEDNIDPESIFSKAGYYARNDETSASEGKYMMPGSLDPTDMTADELFEAENAVDILRNATAGIDRTPISLDDLKEEAEARGMTASELLNRKGVEPGDIAKKLMMYDIAADKLNTKLTNLYAQMNNGTATPTTKNEYLKTLAQFQNLMARVFGEQSEAGRTLRAIRELGYTRQKMDNIQQALSGMQNALNSDEDFAKFATKIQEGLNQESKTKSKLRDAATNMLNLPRALMSSMDFSAPLRQGIFLIGRKEFWKAVPHMFKYFASEGAYNSLMADIASRDSYETMQAAGLSFSRAEGKLSAREEDFMSTWADKVPGVARSNRAYTGFLNKLRADVFDDLMSKYEEANLNPTKDPKLMKDLATFINNATGRGSLGRFTSAAPQLTTVLFSPRLIAARVNMLRPDVYMSMHPAVRKEALKSLVSFGMIAATVIALSVAAGAEVEDDMRSSDFGKIKVGNTRYDVLGGFGQYITLGARLGSFVSSNTYEAVTGNEGWGHYKLTGTGEVKKYNDGKGGPTGQTAAGAAGRFGRNKLAPVPSYIVDYFAGENAIGEKFDAKSSTLERFTPMFMGDLYDMSKEYGPAKGSAMALPGLFGVGVQDFTPKSVDPEAELEAPGTFKDQDYADMETADVSVKDGVVTLKAAARKEWEMRLNFYTQEWMKDEIADPDWAGLSNKEKAERIADVRNDARRETKKDMVGLLGLE